MILNLGETGQGAPVVLLHGLFGAGGNFAGIARRLAAGFRVLSPDLRNHGSSPHSPAMAYAGMAEDVLETLARHGTGPAAVVGHSMGGKVAMQLALLHPGAVSRLVVADIAPVPYPPAFRGFAEAMLALPLQPGLTRGAADQALAAAVPDAGVRAFLLSNLRTGPAPSWRIGLAEVAAALPEIEGWAAPAGTYPGPTLVLRGDRSDYVRPEHRPLFRALFPAARFASLRGAGHWLHADAPEAFAETVRGFLAGEG